MYKSEAHLNNMARVAILSPLPPQRAGESQYTLRLIQTLVKQSKISIVAITGKDADSLPDYNGKVETLRIWDGQSLLYPLRVFQAMRKNRISLAHIQFGPHGKVYGGLFGEVMLILLLLLRLGGIITTVTLHSTWMPHQVIERASTYPKLKRFSFLSAVFFRLYMKLLDVGTNSIQLSTTKPGSALRAEFLQVYKFRPEKVHEIPHPCIDSVFPISRNDALQRLDLVGRQVILIFGYIRRGKGIELAIESVAHLKTQHPSIMLLIGGTPVDCDGMEYLNELKMYASRLKVEDCSRFDSNYIKEENIPYYFSAASVILVPYTDSVGASGPIHNYAIYGIPIVASDVGFHMRESLGGSLILYRNGDSSDLSERLHEILSNPEAQSRIGEKHKDYAIRENWSLCASRTLSNYRLLIISDKQIHKP